MTGLLLESTHSMVSDNTLETNVLAHKQSDLFLSDRLYSSTVFSLFEEVGYALTFQTE